MKISLSSAAAPRLAFFLLLLQSVPAVARGQSNHLYNRGWSIVPLFGLRVGTPLIASGYIGPIYVLKERPTHVTAMALIGEIGTGGGQASVAFLYGGGDYGGFPGSLRLHGSLLRTWSHPWLAAKNATYVGPELQYSLDEPIGIRIGAFRRVDVGSERKRILSVSVTLGL